jgi:hypothetical protein
MKLCKSCATEIEPLFKSADPGLFVSRIGDAVREVLHPPVAAPEPKATKGKAKAGAAVEGAEA